MLIATHRQHVDAVIESLLYEVGEATGLDEDYLAELREQINQRLAHDGHCRRIRTLVQVFLYDREDIPLGDLDLDIQISALAADYHILQQAERRALAAAKAVTQSPHNTNPPCRAVACEGGSTQTLRVAP